MFQIAICDDNEIVCREIEKNLEGWDDISLEVFYSGEKLYETMLSGIVFDLIFLDIELFQLSGVTLGNKIRNEFENDKTHIVYISAKREYAMDLFKSRPLDFIIKPFSSKEIIDAVNKAIKLSSVRHSIFEFKINQTYYKLYLQDILFFESDGRKINIYCKNRKYSIYEKLDDIERKIKCSFLRIHKSYLVNVEHIVEYKYDKIIMSNNERLPISKTNRNKVRNYLLSQWGNRDAK